ncbi:MAG: asparagine synthase (glutamine-hydrolyzing) [Methylomonas sp.]|nr:MAG: asparagine synthase (glutamine-hydrolyzing) [Methylobacter sp.]PPD36735.1 MAG: asparagine synthase (glutamine-hydrolyzing) [Methylomonas sp.]
MCGIVGGNCLPETSIDSLLGLLKHRGPDHQDYFKHRSNFLGHTRLAIIDSRELANQPMQMDDVSIVFNGEIYNYRDIIKAENFECRTRGDTEVILRLYLKYGTGFLNRLNGMFAFCIYDAAKDLFFCARDRYGKKPFYYYHAGGKFIFASEIKAILAQLKFRPPLNRLALQQYLAFQAPIHAQTFFQDIYKLPPGHALTVTADIFDVTCYYDITNIPYHGDSEALAIQTIDGLLNQAVEARLVGDEEVAVLLSGGLDSAMTARLYSEHSDRKINSFSIGYDDHNHYCELALAKQTAQEIGTQHHELRIGINDYIHSFEQILDYLDEPMADSASIPLFLLSGYIHNQNIKVALSGEGSDEIFLGYDNYFNLLNAYSSLPEDPGAYNLSREWAIKNRLFNNRELFFSTGETYTQEQLNILFKGEVIPKLSEYQSPYASKARWLTYIDFKIWIAEVLMSKIDRMSMAHSLEIRTPFLDYRLVEYLLGVDDTIKKGNTNKYLLKQVALKYLSKEIVNRRKKGFSSPFIEWLYDYYQDEILATIRRVNRELMLFSDEFIEFLYLEGKAKRFKQHVYSLFLFARWYEKLYL